MKHNILIASALLVFIGPIAASAQMMGNFYNASGTSTDYRTLGDQWMRQMMGQNYDQYRQEMEEMMGSESFTKIQEAIGGTAAWNGRCPMGYTTGKYGGYGNWGMHDGWGWQFGMGGWSWVAMLLGVVAVTLAVGIPLGILVIIVLLIIKLARSLRK